MFGMNKQSFTEIQLCGIEDTTSPTRKKGLLHVYGVRSSDAAKRLVGVALTDRDAAEIMEQAGYVGEMPTIEVPDRAWFFVAGLGPSHFDKDKMPS